MIRLGTEPSLLPGQYAAAIGPAVCGSVTRLPWQPECCDGALIVTMLMYVDRTRCRDAVESVVSCLRGLEGLPSSSIPASRFMQLHRRLWGKIRAFSIGRRNGFKREEYRALFEKAPVSVVGGRQQFNFHSCAAFPASVRQMPFA